VTARAAFVGDGCDAEDFSAMEAGEIALMNNAAQSEADCDNYEKAMLAESLGAGAIIFSGTMAPSRVFQATWREGDAMLTIPAIGVTQSTGDVLRQGGGQIARVFTDTRIDVLHTYNVFATTLAGDADSTVMAGAHLDSVPEGPGINDNGSGSATMLAIARSFEARGLIPNNRLRFAWLGAEEVGLIGSRYYVRDLVENDPAEFDRIALYLNFDMASHSSHINYYRNTLWLCLSVPSLAPCSDLVRCDCGCRTCMQDASPNYGACPPESLETQGYHA
jgi:Zn-dependent M28 family amino/carboxypeptidase